MSIQQGTRGIPEVPLLGTRKITDGKGNTHVVLADSPQLRSFLTNMREMVLQLRDSQNPPGLPSNLVVTPQAFSNLVQWSRGVDADYHEVLWNTTPTVINATVVNVANSAQWTDNVGQSGVKRYYWVRAHKDTGARSVEVGPIAGTTLAAGSGVAPPKPPPQGVQQVLNTRTGGREYR
jgi:hypothetical protein